MRRRTYLLGIAGSVLGGAVALELHTRPQSVSDAPLSSYSCPPDSVEAPDRDLWCSHTGNDDRGLVLEPSVKQTSDPGAVRLQLTNDSNRSLRFNPASWTIWFEESGEWRELEQTRIGDGVVDLGPGETYEWGFEAVVDLINHRFDPKPATYLCAIGTRRGSPAALFRITDG